MEQLLITSCMAPIVDRFVLALADYLGRRLGIAARFVDDISWQEREKWLDEGRVDVCWLCGLPYIWKAQNDEIELLAAPVMQGSRYAEQPVYFSDVVVHRDSSLHSFEHLRGASWAYNEAHSHSGHLLTRYKLATRGQNDAYFSAVIAAGSHQRALELVLKRVVDASAIDSTVLELVLEAQPEIGAQIRVVDTWGPSPIPPWLVHRRTPPQLRAELRRLLLAMHEEEQGRAVLKLARIARFTKVRDEDYDAIRYMERAARHVALEPRAPAPRSTVGDNL